MALLPSRPLRWDIYQEHFSEAAWLWGQWSAALDSPLYSLDEVAAGLEERLLAHLDGLVLGGLPVAEELLLPALAGEDLGEVAAAAWTLLQAEEADHQDAVIDRLAGADPPVQAAIWRALSLSPRADISRLLPLWHEGSPATQAGVLDIFAPREPDWVRERLDPAFRSGDPQLVAAGLRVVRSSRNRDFLEHVRLALGHPHPEVQREAMTAGLALGLKETWALCRSLALGQGAACRLALGLLSVSPDVKDRAIVAQRLSDPEIREHAVWALGFCADVKAVDLLVQAMSDPTVAKLAGEAFTAVTGASITGDLARAGEPTSPEVEEVHDEDPAPAALPADLLREPHAENVAKWWSKARSKYHPVIRYLQGQPRTTDALRAALSSAPTWRREILWTELAVSLVSPPKCDLWDWARNQLKQLAQVRPVVVDRKMQAQHQQTLR
jgi:uncharacterized protein (TIGR02270 family)